MKAHIRYIAREGVEKDGSAARAYNEKNEQLSKEELARFSEKCAGDRHSFRLIISPELGDRLDLKEYTRELVTRMEKDLGTKLEWIAVNHHNTDNPHTHLVISGKNDRGEDLVLKRDYIGNGIRVRASEIATQALGLRTENDVIRQTMKEITSERFTQLDKNIIERAKETGIADLSKTPFNRVALFRRNAMLQRLTNLHKMGLAQEAQPGKWRISSHAEKILREMGQRGDIIKTMHSKMKGVSVMPECVIYKKDLNALPEITGVVVHKGLSDELSDDQYLIVNSVDGKAYYVPIAKNSERENQESEIGAMVSVRLRDHGFVAVETLCRAKIEEQITASGPTWLDREISQRGLPNTEQKLQSQLQKEIEKAKIERAAVLVRRGLAKKNDKGELKLKSDAFAELEKAEFAAVANKYKAALVQVALKAGDEFSGRVDRIERLSDGTYGVIVNNETKQFTIVPYRDGMEKAHDKKDKITVAVTRERTGFAPARVEVKGHDLKKKSADREQ